MDIKKASNEFLSRGGKITKVPTGARALNAHNELKKKVTVPRNAKVRHHEDGPAGSDTAVVSDQGVEITERPSAAASSDDDEPHRKGHHGHAQHDIAIGRGKKPMVMTTAVVEHTADNDETDELLPGFWKRHPEAAELRDEKTRRRQKRDAKLDAVMSQVKVGADRVGINALRRNMAVAEFRGHDYFTTQTLKDLGVPLAPRPAPRRGHKRHRDVQTPKGSTDFGVEKIVRRVPRKRKTSADVRAENLTEREQQQRLAELEKRIEMENITKEIGALLGAKKADGAKIGALLIRAKKVLDHGKFLPWVKGLGLPARTAQRYEAMVARPGAVPKKRYFKRATTR